MKEERFEQGEASRYIKLKKRRRVYRGIDTDSTTLKSVWIFSNQDKGQLTSVTSAAECTCFEPTTFNQASHEKER
ncbi:hypothetical protein E2P81_ATG11920 [Venturia nashicola]|uniref:Uncharacterized protein n=1 Tax=Venturia nashicola TaxID=86259 RepID=A0A4Z1P684_9PEZI|nr:hypothetical protein E6O75_ATG11613 [Venturia nashicola]TLD24584.1 hypothetical protein E2P81_ATG11920 [Venturia nashicola]